MDLDAKINLQSNLFSLLIHLSILLAMIMTLQWAPKYPYFAEVELWEAIPTVKEQAKAPPKAKVTPVEKIEIEQAPAKPLEKNQDDQAEINLKQKRQKRSQNKRKKNKSRKFSKSH